LGNLVKDFRTSEENGTILHMLLWEGGKTLEIFLA
jgi:hypothetical protein